MELSTLAWEIPWTAEPGYSPWGWWRVWHDWATSLSLFTFMHWRRKWQPIPVFLPGRIPGMGAWWAAVYGVAQSWTRLMWLSSSSRSITKIYQEDIMPFSWKPSFSQANIRLSHFFIKEKDDRYHTVFKSMDSGARFLWNFDPSLCLSTYFISWYFIFLTVNWGIQ